MTWDPADLDRCEHGRHSIDACFDCPGGKSTGNLYLQTPSRYQPDEPLVRGDLNRKRVRMLEDGSVQIRIGTRVHGDPIWVTTYAAPRKYPCSSCTVMVVPGQHSVDECYRNRQANQIDRGDESSG